MPSFSQVCIYSSGKELNNIGNHNFVNQSVSKHAGSQEHTKRATHGSFEHTKRAIYGSQLCKSNLFFITIIYSVLYVQVTFLY